MVHDAAVAWPHSPPMGSTILSALVASRTMTTTATRVAALLLIAFASVACTANADPTTGGPTSSTDQLPTPTAPAPPEPTTDPSPGTSAAVVLADGKHPVHIKKIDVAGHKITFDLVQIDADNMVGNSNPLLRTLPVEPGASVKVVVMNEGVDVVEISLADLPKIRDGNFEMPLFWITVSRGTITSIEEAEGY